jgi:hypothetical protein
MWRSARSAAHAGGALTPSAFHAHDSKSREHASGHGGAVPAAARPPTGGGKLRRATTAVMSSTYEPPYSSTQARRERCGRGWERARMRHGAERHSKVAGSVDPLSAFALRVLPACPKPACPACVSCLRVLPACPQPACPKTPGATSSPVLAAPPPPPRCPRPRQCPGPEQTARAAQEASRHVTSHPTSHPTRHEPLALTHPLPAPAKPASNAIVSHDALRCVLALAWRTCWLLSSSHTPSDASTSTAGPARSASAPPAAPGTKHRAPTGPRHRHPRIIRMHEPHHNTPPTPFALSASPHPQRLPAAAAPPWKAWRSRPRPSRGGRPVRGSWPVRGSPARRAEHWDTDGRKEGHKRRQARSPAAPGRSSTSPSSLALGPPCPHLPRQPHAEGPHRPLRPQAARHAAARGQDARALLRGEPPGGQVRRLPARTRAFVPTLVRPIMTHASKPQDFASPAGLPACGRHWSTPHAMETRRRLSCRRRHCCHCCRSCCRGRRSLRLRHCREMWEGPAARASRPPEGRPSKEAGRAGG